MRGGHVVRRALRAGAGGAPPPSGDTPQFFSDWSTATGQSASALRDGTKWPRVGFWTAEPEDGSVVSAAGLGFPDGMANVLRTPYSPAASASASMGNVTIYDSDALIPEPGIGQTLFFRFYFRNALRDTVTGTQAAHPFQGFGTASGTGWTTTNCSQQWWLKVGSVGPSTPGKMGFGWEFNAASSNGGRTNASQFYIDGQSPGGYLNKNQTYLVELALTRTSAFLWTVNTRLDGANANDRFGAQVPPTFSWSPLADLNTDIAIAANCLTSLFVGNNDPGGALVGADPALDFMYYGGVAVRVSNSATDWIGAYQSGRGW